MIVEIGDTAHYRRVFSEPCTLPPQTLGTFYRLHGFYLGNLCRRQQELQARLRTDADPQQQKRHV